MRQPSSKDETTRNSMLQMRSERAPKCGKSTATTKPSRNPKEGYRTPMKVVGPIRPTTPKKSQPKEFRQSLGKGIPARNGRKTTRPNRKPNARLATQKP
ncbi:hypothetical protein LIER_16956 [Lithospermum erythrorhizon]|uniref:Uncharacterized protein n=1 Tax=Lithospermum erythrorhizon TaxID=34254 RepID=A0AAV3QAH5_LITER